MMKSKFVKFLIAIIVVIIILFGSIVYFIVANDAPFIKGEVIRKVEYKDNFKLDIYSPTKLVYEKTPVVLFFHGGAWITGAKESINVNRFNGAINTLREKGYAVLSPNYTLAKKNKSPFPNCLNDAFDAINWIENNANEYNFDLNNVGLFGESAGAHIALMAAFADGDKFSSNKNNIKINYVVDAYGPTDLKKIYNMDALDSLYAFLERLPNRVQDRLNISHYLFGFDPETDTLKRNFFMEEYSPLNYLNTSSPPILIIHGESDRLVPLEQSLLLKSALDSVNVKNEIHTLKNVDHAFRGANKQQKENIQKWIVDFIENHYNK